MTGLIKDNLLTINGVDYTAEQILSGSSKIIIQGINVVSGFSPISMPKEYNYICFKDGVEFSNPVVNGYFYGSGYIFVLILKKTNL